ncbi:MAG: hypothetical protein ACYC2G_01215 [Gemmatimonadaceae bacterium]
MFGCLRRLGCLVVLLVIAGAAWLTRDAWYPRYFGSPAAAEVTAEATWEAVTPAVAERGRSQLARLAGPRPAGAISLRPAEAVGVVLDSLTRQLGTGERGMEAAVIGDRLYLRASVPLGELGGDILGPLTGMVDGRETVLLGGTLDVIRPGLAQFRVTEVKVRDFNLPSGVVPRLLRELRRGTTPPDGVAANAVPLRLPESVGAVNVGKGRVALYRETVR